MRRCIAHACYILMYCNVLFVHLLCGMWLYMCIYVSVAFHGAHALENYNVNAPKRFDVCMVHVEVILSYYTPLP